MSIRENILVRRAWFVPGLAVYGLPSADTVGYLVVQRHGAEATVFHAEARTGESSQVVPFASLTDHRGNPLPESINTPRVIIRPRSAETAFLTREESNREFAIARDPETTGPVTVDLLIMEMGA